MSAATCYGPACDRATEVAGLCHAHYEQQRRRGGADHMTPLRPTDAKTRFFQKVVKRGDGCWVWQGATDGRGRYGSFQHEGVVQRAHRVAYQWTNGPIPEGMVLDHLCRVTLCVNPEHVEPVTQTENIMRGLAIQSFNARKLRCERGHEFVEGSYRLMSTGGRQCVLCEQLPEMKARRAWQRRKCRAARQGIPFDEPAPPLPPKALTPYEATLPAKQAA